MKKPARKHHYIPQFYLAGFTEEGNKDSFMWVLDQDTGNQWRSKPHNVAFQKDYNRVNLPDTEIDALENGFALFEDKAAKVIKEMNETHKIPKDDSYIILMNFIAFMFAVTPYMRNTLIKPMKDISKKMLRSIVASPENFHSTVKQMKEDGVDIEDVSYESMRDFVKRDKYSIDFDNNTYLNNTLLIIDGVIPYLIKRNWTMLITDTSNCEFICSDNPVSLHWIKPIQSIYGPGFAMQNTDVTIPINKQIALLGRYENVISTKKISQRSVAIMNSYSGMHSTRYLFSAKQNFIWYRKDKNIGTVTDMIKIIKSKK